MIKPLLAALLAAFVVSAQAKPVAVLVEPTGKVVLTDEKCTLAPDGFHLQGYNNEGGKTFFGCWLEDGDDLFLLSNMGAMLVVPKAAFKWITNL